MIEILKRGSILLTTFALFACSNPSQKTDSSIQAKSTNSTHIVLGSVGSDAQIWRFIASTQATKNAGLNIEVKELTDGIALNQGLIDQKLDVNAFQSWSYLKAFNEKNGNKLQAIATTYLEPMGLYSKRYKTLDQLPNGATVIIPSDTANTARALSLLNQAGLIKLKTDFNPALGNLNDIQNNPKKFNIKLVQGATLPRVLGDVDLAAIGNTNALESGLNVIHDALAYEKNDEKVINNINLLVVDKNRINEEKLQKLGALYHQPAVVEYIKQHFGGTKISINQNVNSFH